MEINADVKEISAYKISYQGTKSVLETTEAVIPDTCGDVSRIVKCDACFRLASKEIRDTELTVTGVITANILYIEEGGGKLNNVQVQKQISTFFDTQTTQKEFLTHIQAAVRSCEASALNPRKLSVTVSADIMAFCYAVANTVVSTGIEGNGIQKRTAKSNCIMLTDITEKSFVVTDQLIFEKEIAPERIACVNPEAILDDIQIVGRKAVVKGRLKLFCETFSEDGTLKISTFDVPFTQLAEVNEGGGSYAEADALITSQYFSISDTISGAKALESEVHLLLQLRTYSETEISYVDDAYSARCSCICENESVEICCQRKINKKQLNIEEKFELPDDCENILFVLPETSDTDADTKQINLNIVYSAPTGELSYLRRNIKVPENNAETGNSISRRIKAVSYEFQKPELSVKAEIEYTELFCTKENISFVRKLEIDEDDPFRDIPTLTIVIPDNEDLWSIAKRYHSSIEKISEFNDLENIKGETILVPRCR